MENDIVQTAPNQKIETIILNGEKVTLRKNNFFSGYRIVYPIKDESGKIIWPNLLFGGWANLFKLGFILIVIGLAVLGYQETNQALISCQEVVKNLPKF